MPADRWHTPAARCSTSKLSSASGLAVTSLSMTIYTAVIIEILGLLASVGPTCVLKIDAYFNLFRLQVQGMLQEEVIFRNKNKSSGLSLIKASFSTVNRYPCPSFWCWERDMLVWS